MSEKQYVVAPKRQAAGDVPEDWQEQLAGVEGVSVLGATPRRAQFVATPEAAELVREALGDDFHVEEAAERGPV